MLRAQHGTARPDRRGGTDGTARYRTARPGPARWRDPLPLSPFLPPPPTESSWSCSARRLRCRTAPCRAELCCAGLGCAGLCWAGLCCAALGCAVLCCAGLCWAVLCCVVPGRAVPGRAGPCRAAPGSLADFQHLDSGAGAGPCRAVPGGSGGAHAVMLRTAEAMGRRRSVLNAGRGDTAEGAPGSTPGGVPRPDPPAAGRKLREAQPCPGGAARPRRGHGAPRGRQRAARWGVGGETPFPHLRGVIRGDTEGLRFLLGGAAGDQPPPPPPSSRPPPLTLPPSLPPPSPLPLSLLLLSAMVGVNRRLPG